MDTPEDVTEAEPENSKLIHEIVGYPSLRPVIDLGQSWYMPITPTITPRILSAHVTTMADATGPDTVRLCLVAPNPFPGVSPFLDVVFNAPPRGGYKYVCDVFGIAPTVAIV